MRHRGQGSLVLLGLLLLLLAPAYATEIKVGPYTVAIRTMPDPPVGKTQILLALQPAGAKPELTASRLDPPYTMMSVPLQLQSDRTWAGTADLGSGGMWKIDLVVRGAAGLAAGTMHLTANSDSLRPAPPIPLDTPETASPQDSPELEPSPPIEGLGPPPDSPSASPASTMAVEAPARHLHRGNEMAEPEESPFLSRPEVTMWFVPAAGCILALTVAIWVLAMLRGWAPTPGTWVVSGLSVMVLIVGALALSTPSQPDVGASPVPLSEPTEAAVIPVAVDRVVPGTIARTLDVTAEVEPGEVAFIKAKTAGVVQRILVKNGQKIDLGDALAMMLSTPAASPTPKATPKATPTETPAGSETSESVRMAKAEVQNAEDDIKRDQREADDANKAWQDAEADLAPEKHLLDSGAIAREEYDTKVHEADEAKTRHETAETRLSDDRTALLKKKDVLRTAQVMERQLSALSSQPSPTPAIEGVATAVSAPTPGVLGACLVKEGATVKAGAPLFKIVGYNAVRLVARIPTQRARGMVAGMAVDVAGSPDQPPVRTKVVSVIRPAQGPYTFVTCKLTNAKQAFSAGSPAHMSLELERHTNVLTVRKTAIVRPSGRPGVWIVGERLNRKVAVFAPIQTGLDDGERVEATSGLHPGDTVVWEMASPLRNGATILVNDSTSAETPETDAPTSSDSPSSSPLEVPSGSPSPGSMKEP